MALNLPICEIDYLWRLMYRPYEIYVKNDKPVEYCGELHDAGTIDGWEIRFVFSTRKALESYPYFDAVIGVDCIANCEEVWHG